MVGQLGPNLQNYSIDNLKPFTSMLCAHQSCQPNSPKFASISDKSYFSNFTVISVKRNNNLEYGKKMAAMFCFDLVWVDAKQVFMTFFHNNVPKMSIFLDHNQYFNFSNQYFVFLISSKILMFSNT